MCLAPVTDTSLKLPFWTHKIQPATPGLLKPAASPNAKAGHGVRQSACNNRNKYRVQLLLLQPSNIRRTMSMCAVSHDMHDKQRSGCLAYQTRPSDSIGCGAHLAQVYGNDSCRPRAVPRNVLLNDQKLVFARPENADA